jgi:hypothetical protein
MLLEKEHEVLKLKLKAEYDADRQEIESQIRHLQSQATVLRTEVQNLESARRSFREAEVWMQKIEEPVDNSSILSVIVSLIKNPTTLKSHSEILKAMHAILEGFKTYLESVKLHTLEE